MRMNKYLGIFMGMVVGSSALAANWDWDGDAFPDSSWSNPTNWKNNVMYGSGDIPLFRPGDFATVELGDTIALPSSVFRLGQDGSGTAEVQILGGDLTIANNSFIGFRGADCTGIMTISNGSFTVSGDRDLIMADQDSSGILNMYGGTVEVSRGLKLRAGLGSSTIRLYGGTLSTRNLEVSLGANVDITLESGLLEIEGNTLSNITAMVSAGDITGTGSKGGADVSAYTFVTNNVSGDLNWGLSVTETSTNTVVYTVGTAAEASVSLDPSTQLTMGLVAPATLSTGSFDISFSYGSGSNNVEITGVTVDNAAFTSLDSFPIVLSEPVPSNETLSIQFDNAVASLSNHLQTASGTITVEWNEIGGSAKTTTLPVLLTYDNQPATLNLAPSDILPFTVMSPATAATKSVDLSYTAATVDPTNVVVLSVAYTNVIKGGAFTNLTSLPITLSTPELFTDALDIRFDAQAGGLAVNEMAKANMIIKWYELGHGVTNETLLPLVGSYLAPATGFIEDYGLTMPTNNIVFDSGAVNGATMDAERGNLATGGDYKKIYQEIKGTEPKLATVTTFDGILLKMRFAVDFSGTTNAANQLQFWFGKIDETTGDPVSTLALETFDCSGISFAQHAFYQFKLSGPVNFDPANLGVGEAYGFEIWWTAEDSANSIDFWRGNLDVIQGGANNTSGNVSINPGFPVTMSNRTENKDMIFALASGLSLVNSVGDVSVAISGTSVITCFDAEAGGVYALQHTDDLVNTPFTNIVENISGDGEICITNDTDGAKSFYRIILQ